MEGESCRRCGIIQLGEDHITHIVTCNRSVGGATSRLSRWEIRMAHLAPSLFFRTPLTLTPRSISSAATHAECGPSDAFEPKYHPLHPLPRSPPLTLCLRRVDCCTLRPPCSFTPIALFISPFSFTQFVPYLRRHARYNGSRMMLSVAGRPTKYAGGAQLL